MTVACPACVAGCGGAGGDAFRRALPSARPTPFETLRFARLLRMRASVLALLDCDRKTHLNH